MKIGSEIFSTDIILKDKGPLDKGPKIPYKDHLSNGPLSFVYFKKLLSIFVFILALGAHLHAQDLDADMKLFYKGFTSLSSIECEMTSRAVNKKDQSFFFDKKIHLIIHNNQFYYNMGDMIYISNKEHLLWIDKNDKRIIVGKTDPNEIQRFKKQLAKQTDTIKFKTRGEIIFDGVNGNIKTYRVVKFQHPYIEEAKISFDATTGYLKKMEYVFNSAPGNSISSSFTEFTLINTNPVISDSQFNIDEYVTIKKDVITLTSGYKKYQLIIIDHSLLDRLKK